jgi:hypothetical protein
MVRSTVAQFMGTLPLFIGLGILSFRRGCDIDRANVQKKNGGGCYGLGVAMYSVWVNLTK